LFNQSSGVVAVIGACASRINYRLDAVVTVVVVDGSCIGVLFRFVRPKDAPKDETKDETKDENGETGFASANSAGSCGATKKSKMPEYQPDTDEFKLVIEERATVEIVFAEDKTNGSGGAETDAAGGAFGATVAAETFRCQFPIKINGVSKASNKISTISRVFKLNSIDNRNNRNKPEPTLPATAFKPFKYAFFIFFLQQNKNSHLLRKPMF
jgi:hypothetical protein